MVPKGSFSVAFIHVDDNKESTVSTLMLFCHKQNSPNDPSFSVLLFLCLFAELLLNKKYFQREKLEIILN